MTLRANPVGFHTTLTPHLADEIVDAIYDVLIPCQAAALVGIHRSRIYEWTDWGDKDLKDGKDSIYGQLASRIHEARAKKLKYLLKKLQNSDTKNTQSIIWMLEKCFKEHFGADNEEIKQLREIFKQILPLIGKGESFNGQDAQGKQTQESSEKS